MWIIAAIFITLAISFVGTWVYIAKFAPPVAAAPSDDFVTTWKTDNPGSSNSTSITIPTTGTGYNYSVDWDNNGTFEQTGITGNVTHNFGVAGTYTIRITGSFPRIFFNNSGDRRKILSINQWGTGAWTSMASAFRGASNLTSTATDVPNLAGVSLLSGMFQGATLFNANLSGWNTSTITDMSNMFSGASSFNGNVTTWNTSNVTTMLAMFQNATVFNQNISTWNTSNVTSMVGTFQNATAFNQNISSWDTSSVLDMSATFSGAAAFNQNISAWDVSNVTTMLGMFSQAASFNQDLSAWDTGSVQSFNSMFAISSFNGDISTWDTSSATNMSGMFLNNPAFNQDISGWDMSSVTIMFSAFNGAAAFNQDISDWNVSALQTANSIFDNSGLSQANYDAALRSWANQPLLSDVGFGVLGLDYCAGAAARQLIATTYTWSFIGDSLTACDLYLDGGTTASVQAGNPASTKVGDLSVVNFDVASYAVACSSPTADDALFKTSGTELQTNTVLTYHSGGDNTYDVCVKATDTAGNPIEHHFDITVTAGVTPPVDPTPPTEQASGSTSSPATEDTLAEETPATSIQADDQNVTDMPEISSQPTFSGYADPYSTVTVTVFSDPVTCATTADATGYWECRLSSELPAGVHNVYVKVQQVDGTVTELGPYQVSVSEDKETIVDSDDTPAESTVAVPWGWIIGAGAALVLLIIIIVVARRRKEA